jgi:hypothetical protein
MEVALPRSKRSETVRSEIAGSTALSFVTHPSQKARSTPTMIPQSSSEGRARPATQQDYYFERGLGRVSCSRERSNIMKKLFGSAAPATSGKLTTTSPKRGTTASSLTPLYRLERLTNRTIDKASGVLQLSPIPAVGLATLPDAERLSISWRPSTSPAVLQPDRSERRDSKPRHSYRLSGDVLATSLEAELLPLSPDSRSTPSHNTRKAKQERSSKAHFLSLRRLLQERQKIVGELEQAIEEEIVLKGLWMGSEERRSAQPSKRSGRASAPLTPSFSEVFAANQEQWEQEDMDEETIYRNEQRRNKEMQWRRKRQMAREAEANKAKRFQGPPKKPLMQLPILPNVTSKRLSLEERRLMVLETDDGEKDQEPNGQQLDFGDFETNRTPRTILRQEQRLKKVLRQEAHQFEQSLAERKLVGLADCLSQINITYLTGLIEFHQQQGMQSVSPAAAPVSLTYAESNSVLMDWLEEHRRLVDRFCTAFPRMRHILAVRSNVLFTPQRLETVNATRSPTASDPAIGNMEDFLSSLRDKLNLYPADDRLILQRWLELQEN